MLVSTVVSRLIIGQRWNWSVRHWQIMIFCNNAVQNHFLTAQESVMSFFTQEWLQWVSFQQPCHTCSLILVFLHERSSVWNQPALCMVKHSQLIQIRAQNFDWEPSSQTQGLLAGTMQYSWARDIYGWKFTLRAEEPMGTYSYWLTSSRSGRIPSCWLTRKIFFWPISEGGPGRRLCCLLSRSGNTY